MKTNRGERKGLPLPSDAETLKAWCHWKRLERGASEDDLEFAKAVEDTISQVNNWKAKAAQKDARIGALEEAIKLALRNAHDKVVMIALLGNVLKEPDRKV